MSDLYSSPRQNGRLPAREWFEAKRQQYHGAFLSPSTYDEQRAEYVIPKKPQPNIVQLHTDNFKRAVEVYRRNARHDCLSDLDLGEAHTWNDVVRHYEAARQYYHGKAKGARGIMRKAGRLVGDNVSATEPLVMSLIPQNDYTSTLCCGLVLIFGAAGRMSEKRRFIFESLGDVPSTIEEAEGCCEDFLDETLRGEVVELYVTILIAIMEMMVWLVEKGGLKQMKALLQGPQYAQSLEEKVKDVQKHLVSVRDRVEILLRRTILDIDSRTGQMKKDTDYIKDNTDYLKELQRKEFDKRAKREAQLLKSIDAQNKSIDAQNGMLNLLLDTFQKAEWNERSRRLELEVQSLHARLYKAQTVLSAFQLLEILAVDLERAASEAALMLRQGATLDPSYQSRGWLLMLSREFQAWQNSASSSCLLVNGKDWTAVGRISAMTIVCALLARSLLDESAVSIQFFCGLHTNPEDTLSGPRGLLRSLIAQIVIIRGCSMRIPDNDEYQELLQYDTQRLCHLLEDQVLGLPPNFVLFCIIDGISFFESVEWRNDACLVMNTISRLASNSQKGTIFKVLVTSPVASRYVVGQVPEEDRLYLRPDSMQTDGSTMSPRSMMMQLRRPREPSVAFEDPHASDLFTTELSDTEGGFVDGRLD